MGDEKIPSLRDLREARGLSIDQLADLTKIHRTVLYRMEALETAPRADNLARVCIALALPHEQAGTVLFSYEDYWRHSIRAAVERWSQGLK